MLDDKPQVASDWDMLDMSKPVKAEWPLANVILFFSADWCGPCKTIKKDVFPDLKSKNWRIGTDSDSHIYLIDSDKQPEMLSDYEVNALPTLIRLKDGKVVDRLVGTVSSKQITDMWYKHVDQAKTQRAAYLKHTGWTYHLKPHNRERYIQHLLHENNHVRKFSVELLNSMSLDELLALHSDDHAGTVDWLSLGIQRTAQSGNCATGNCQTIQQYRIPRRSFFGLLEW